MKCKQKSTDIRFIYLSHLIAQDLLNTTTTSRRKDALIVNRQSIASKIYSDSCTNLTVNSLQLARVH
jgi:hypothetical protein